ncbi:hypothetical protein BRADI_2g54421v3 [Brachypodium distachyon]|uniref:Uncharacterized protein n=1 Tax=Brachypodium distachyon TaxID=15368 RepID=A0A2K2DFV0_BRADI|nr:hypothetical protein BRADI_2g54421v3 [Brachypodium distachyon]
MHCLVSMRWERDWELLVLGGWDGGWRRRNQGGGRAGAWLPAYGGGPVAAAAVLCRRSCRVPAPLTPRRRGCPLLRRCCSTCSFAAAAALCSAVAAAARPAPPPLLLRPCFDDARRHGFSLLRRSVDLAAAAPARDLLPPPRTVSVGRRSRTSTHREKKEGSGGREEDREKGV